MKLSSRRSPYLVAAGVLSILLGLTGAWSQTARTVKIVVPYPAGGTAESFAALIAKEIVQWRDLAQSAKITLD